MKGFFQLKGFLTIEVGPFCVDHLGLGLPSVG